MHVQLFRLVWIFVNPTESNSPGSSANGIPQQEYWMCCHFLLQGIFPTQGLNPYLQWFQNWPGDSLSLSHLGSPRYNDAAAATAAKSLQLCRTLCDAIEGSPPGSSVPGILHAKMLEWVAISFSNAWKWKVKVKWLSLVRLFTTPWTAAYQALRSMGVYRQRYWSEIIMLAIGFSLNSFNQVEEITSYYYIVRYFYHISYHISYQTTL